MIIPNLRKKKIIWGKGKDILKIKKVYLKIAPLVKTDIPDAITREKIKKLLKEALPDYEIKYDEENNSPEIVDDGKVIARVWKPTLISGSYKYVDLIF